MTLLSGSRFGSYEILFPLGAGGMGQVFAAKDSRLGRKVALKILPGESMERPDRVRRFEQEARAASALNHPNILTVYEIGELDGVHFMATEYVDGQTIRGLLKTPVPLAQALDIAVQTTGALAVAHDKGIVHRDIKPENIMVRPDGYVKVLDFGLAKLNEAQTQTSLPNEGPTMASALTRPGQVIGTFRYMSPEQARGLELDARTDIWSFGTVLYEMVTGTAPFAAPTATDTLARILERQPSPVVEASSGAPPELQRILNKALVKDRKERYQSMKEFETDLRELRHDLDLTAKSRHVDKTREGSVVAKKVSGMGVGLAAIVFVLILASLAFAWWLRHSRTKSAVLPPLPQREITYQLFAQKLRAGKPYGEEFPTTSEQVFDSNWRMRLNFSSPQAGSLYVFDQEQSAEGAQELSLFFPLPGTNNGVAHLAARQRVATDWARFEQRPGSEKFWIVWSANPVPELENTVQAVSNPHEMGIIHDTTRIAEIESLFSEFQTPAQNLRVDGASGRSTIRGPGDIVVTELTLEHR